MSAQYTLVLPLLFEVHLDFKPMCMDQYSVYLIASDGSAVCNSEFTFLWGYKHMHLTTSDYDSHTKNSFKSCFYIILLHLLYKQ